LSAPFCWRIMDETIGITETAMISENGLRISMSVVEGETLLARWRQRVRQRALLGRLIETSPHLIDDIGLNRADAALEARKPFWQA